MKKWILLIGLLSYSSVGWSKTLIMECWGSSDPNKNGVIIKMETNEPLGSPLLLMYRSDDGTWDSKCESSTREGHFCKKGDQSVTIFTTMTPEDVKRHYDRGYKSIIPLIPHHTETSLDFRFLRGRKLVWSFDRSELTHMSKLECTKIE